MTMWELVRGLSDQLRWAVDVDVPQVPDDRPVVVLGMGGSGMAAAVAALAAEGGRPVVVHRSYDLPSWAVPSGALVVAVSYSGNTEETLSGTRVARDAGLPVVGVTSGGRLRDLGVPVVAVPPGLPPRAAVGFQAGGALRILAAAGLVGDAPAALEEAADAVDAVLGDGDGPAITLGRDLAEALRHRIPVVYGGFPVGALAAYRWKTQVNENAKRPAYSGEVPEMNHNELEGWAEAAELGIRCVGIVRLRDAGDHPRVARRLDLVAEAVGDRAAFVGEVRSVGEGPLARFFTLAVVGDAASVALAEGLGVDPMPVDLIEGFKRRLGPG